MYDHTVGDFVDCIPIRQPRRLNLPRAAERFSEESANPEIFKCQYKDHTTTIKTLAPLHLLSTWADKELEGICCYGINNDSKLKKLVEKKKQTTNIFS